MIRRFDEDRLHVLHVVSNLGIGGIQSLLLNYARELESQGVVFDFAVLDSEKGQLEDELSSLGSRITHLLREPGEKLFPGNFFEKLLVGERYEIVHTHTDLWEFAPLHVAKRCGVPVRIAHAHMYKAKTDLLRGALRAYCARRIRANATDFWCCSEWAGESLFKRQLDLHVMYNAIDPGRFAFDETARRDLRERLGIDGLCVGHVGRQSEEKNRPLLLRAFAEVVQQVPATLLLVGCDEGYYERELSALASSLGIDPNVICLPPQAEVARFYSAMDVFCLPSRFEGLGIVAIEAQANGLGVVASMEGVPKEADVSGSVDFVSLQAGAKEWADALMKAPCRTSEKGNPVAGSPYDIAVAAKRLADDYHRLADSARRRREGL